jgi:metacaspase-1
VSEQFFAGHALVIGVANYPNFMPLPTAVLKDSIDVANLLLSGEHCGYPAGQVERLLDGQATAAEIRAGFGRLAKMTGPGDTAVVFFSGHGGREKNGESYLIPFDADPKKLATTALSGAELTTAFSAIGAGRLVVILDACHSAGAGELKGIDPTETLKGGLDRKVIEALARGSGRAILSSCRADEFSFILQGMDNSLFTHYLLEALKGDAATRGDGMIRVFDVFEHVSDRVPTRTPGQHPNFKAHGLESNFALALERGGSKSAKRAAEVTVARRPNALSGKVKIALVQHLIDRWEDLADYFEIPGHDRKKFPQGSEPRGVLSWLDQRRRLVELRDAFNYLAFDDLIADLEAHSD